MVLALTPLGCATQQQLLEMETQFKARMTKMEAGLATEKGRVDQLTTQLAAVSATATEATRIGTEATRIGTDARQRADAAAAKGDTGTDLAARLQAYAQAQSILVSDLPVAPLYYRGRMVLVKPWVQNLVITPKDDYPGLSFLNAVSVSKH